MRCPACGKQNKEDALFCGWCGSPIKGSAPVEVASPVAPAEPVAPVVPVAPATESVAEMPVEPAAPVENTSAVPPAPVEKGPVVPPAPIEKAPVVAQPPVPAPSPVVTQPPMPAPSPVNVQMLSPAPSSAVTQSSAQVPVVPSAVASVVPPVIPVAKRKSTKNMPRTIIIAVCAAVQFVSLFLPFVSDSNYGLNSALLGLSYFSPIGVLMMEVLPIVAIILTFSLRGKNHAYMPLFFAGLYLSGIVWVTSFMVEMDYSVNLGFWTALISSLAMIIVCLIDLHEGKKKDTGVQAQYPQSVMQGAVPVQPVSGASSVPPVQSVGVASAAPLVSPTATSEPPTASSGYPSGSVSASPSGNVSSSPSGSVPASPSEIVK